MFTFIILVTLISNIFAILIVPKIVGKVYQSAVHEMSHVICSIKNQKYPRISHVSLVQRDGDHLFKTFYEDSTSIYNDDFFVNRLIILLAGDIGESTICSVNNLLSHSDDELLLVKSIINKQKNYLQDANKIDDDYSFDNFEYDLTFNDIYSRSNYLVLQYRQQISYCAKVLVMKETMTLNEILFELDSYTF